MVIVTKKCESTRRLHFPPYNESLGNFRTYIIQKKRMFFILIENQKWPTSFQWNLCKLMGPQIIQKFAKDVKTTLYHDDFFEAKICFADVSWVKICMFLKKYHWLQELKLILLWFRPYCETAYKTDKNCGEKGLPFLIRFHNDHSVIFVLVFY